MISNLIPLIGSFVNSGIFPYSFYLIFALAFLATIPSFVRLFFRG